MSRPRRPRALSSDERRLWAHVARAVTPLVGRTYPEEPPEAPEPAVLPPAPAPAPAVPAPRRPAAPAIPPLAPFDRKTMSSLRRGSQGVEAVIDLHGLRQAEAHDALLTFLRRSQDLQRSIVLVITGKGGAASWEASPFEERGVLRRSVPHWLRLPDLRPLVLGFEEAAPHHGGSGALYVRLRRRRPPGTGS